MRKKKIPKRKPSASMLKRLTIQTDSGCLMGQHNSDPQTLQPSPPKSQILDSNYQLLYFFFFFWFCFQLRTNERKPNMLLNLKKSDDSLLPSLSPASPMSVYKASFHRLSHSSACLGVSAKQKPRWLTLLL